MTYLYKILGNAKTRYVVRQMEERGRIGNEAEGNLKKCDLVRLPDCGSCSMRVVLSAKY